MKKIIIEIIGVLVVGAIVGILIINFSEKNENKTTKSNTSSESVKSSSKTETTESNEKNENNETTTNSTETKEKESSDGYEIIVSKKDITIEKGSKASFDITFTNPDETSIREYINCEKQDDIVVVSYSPLENKKITVYVEALKVGTTEIDISDYNYPNVKQIVKVNVVEKN